MDLGHQWKTTCEGEKIAVSEGNGDVERGTATQQLGIDVLGASVLCDKGFNELMAARHTTFFKPHERRFNVGVHGILKIHIVPQHFLHMPGLDKMPEAKKIVHISIHRSTEVARPTKELCCKHGKLASSIH